MQMAVNMVSAGFKKSNVKTSLRLLFKQLSRPVSYSPAKKKEGEGEMNVIYNSKFIFFYVKMFIL